MGRITAELPGDRIADTHSEGLREVVVQDDGVLTAPDEHGHGSGGPSGRLRVRESHRTRARGYGHQQDDREQREHEGAINETPHLRSSSVTLLSEFPFKRGLC